MAIKKFFLIIFLYSLTSCYSKNEQNAEVLKQLYNNQYSYNRDSSSASISNAVSAATLSSTKYTKHRRPQRRFVHRAYN